MRRPQRSTRTDPRFPTTTLFRSIPELGPVKAAEPPIVVITSTRTREVHDALRRRCLYHWVEYPSFETESQIVARSQEHTSALQSLLRSSYAVFCFKNKNLTHPTILH